ncbi:MAG: DUF2723 domain-containing protein [Nitrospirota bacterium]
MAPREDSKLRLLARTFAGPAVFFGSFTVYLLTLAPGITFWDSGELATAAWSLGIPHPPGYPLFCILGKAFTFLPLGNVAYRLNVMSAFFAACSVYVLFLMVRGALRDMPFAGLLAAASALSFAFYSNFWGVSVITAVRTLSIFLLAVTAYSLLRFEESRDVRWLHLSAFFMGLSFVGHETAYFIVPAYAVYYLSHARGRRAPVFMVSAGLFVLAWSSVLYLPLRGQAGPIIDLGRPDTFDNIIWVMKWDKYGVMFRSFLGNISSSLTWARTAAGAAGALVSAALIYLLRGRRWLLFMLFAGAFYYFCLTFLTLGDVAVKNMGLLGKYYNPVFIFLIPALAALVRMLWEKLPKKSSVIPAAAASLLFVLPAASLVSNYAGMDNRENFFAYDIAGNELKSVKPFSVIFSWGDNGVFPVWYRQGVEKYRDDVLFIHSEILTYGWYMNDREAEMYSRYGVAFSPRAPLADLRKNVDGMVGRLKEKTSVYFDFSSAAQLNIPMNYLLPQGLVWMVPPGNPDPLGRIWDRYCLRGAMDDSTNKAFAVEGILDIYGWEAAVWSQTAASEGRLREAYRAYLMAGKLGFRNEQLDRWAVLLQRQLQGAGN